MKILIVGGVAAGMSAAARLRRLDEQAEITVYEMSDHVSYANCGLPYFVSDVISEKDSLLLQNPTSLWNRFKIKAKVRHVVRAINREAKTIEVENLTDGKVEYVDYDKLILATGARPHKPDYEGMDRALTLRNVEEAEAVKLAIQRAAEKTVAIIGGGFIGIELAENLSRLGAKVTVIQRGSRILSQFDPEMISGLHSTLEKQGIRIVLNAQVDRVTEEQVILQDGEKIAAAVLISSAGVTPDNLLAKSAGLLLGPSGGLWVDQQQRTNDPDIYAAGDAVEKQNAFSTDNRLVPLANLANRHGRLIADAIAGLEVAARPATGTVILGAFGHTVAITGLSENAAKTVGVKHQVIHVHPNNHAGYYPGARKVSLKILFDPETGLILGGQGYGDDGVDKRIDVISTAMMGKLTVDDLMDLELAYAPQFGSAKDAVNIVGYVGNNVRAGVTPTIQWHELDEAVADGAQLVDVRSASEFGNGHIPDSLNVPVEDLRDRLDEIRKTDVIVYCQVGQRGHVATQILKAHGAKVRNLDGGYLTWSQGQMAKTLSH